MDERNIKMEKLLDMQDNPENYSDEELEVMLNDEEIQEDIKCIVAMRRAAIIDSNEREISNKEHFSHNARILPLYKFAAIFIGCIFIAGIAFAAVHFIKEREPKSIAENTEKIVKKASLEDIEMKTDTVSTAKATLIVFDGEELEVVARAMAEYYGLNVRFDSEEAKHVKLFFRWDKKTPISNIVEILNKYDRISIELVDRMLIIK